MTGRCRSQLSVGSEHSCRSPVDLKVVWGCARWVIAEVDFMMYVVRSCCPSMS